MSATLGFMHSSYRENIFKNLNMVNFLFEKWGLIVCLSLCAIEFENVYLCAVAHADILKNFGTHTHK